ncbi:hypothetical protein [Massilia aquatica]|uniref:Uncharacterized protein n=1 Tax=Massilia aquatica TaxID=2609000 RepID=A0ABX0M8H5_9BURK|nr:hypothetical protein [Massilia aquatica]NHZ43272.1 hypothetical protein [Massilia aquatica]
MNSTLRSFFLPLFVTALATASPSFAQDSTQASTPAAAAVPALPRHPVYASKGPVSLYVNTYGDELTYLRIVHRSHVVGGNVGRMALSLLGTREQTHNKEDFLGDAVTDTRKPQNLISPLLLDLPKALDEKFVAVLAEKEGSGAAPRKNGMTITPLGWHLLYNELMAGTEREDEYVLRFAARFSKRPEGATDSFFRKVQDTARSCGYVSKPRKLSAWKANDYEAVAAEQKLATQSCLAALTSSMPEWLGIDTSSKIKSAKLNCQTEMNLCVAEADTTVDPKASKVECKVEYKQCVSEDVKPLVDSTPIGACKATFATCKAAVIEKARAINPGVKPEKSEYLPCTAELKACVKTVKDGQ